MDFGKIPADVIQHKILSFLPLSGLFEVEFVMREFRDLVNKIRVSGYHSRLLRERLEKTYGQWGIVQWLEQEQALVSGSTILSFITGCEFENSDLDTIAYDNDSLEVWLNKYNIENLIVDKDSIDYKSIRSVTNKYNILVDDLVYVKIDVTTPYKCTLLEHVDSYDLDFLKNYFDGHRLVVTKKNSIMTKSSFYQNPSLFDPTNSRDEYKFLKAIGRCKKYEYRGYTIFNYWSKNTAMEYMDVLTPICCPQSNFVELLETGETFDIKEHFRIFEETGLELLPSDFIGDCVVDRIKRCLCARTNNTRTSFNFRKSKFCNRMSDLK
jgi:hypothetical protein